MALKNNLHYWKISLENPEPISDEFYVMGDIILTEELAKKADRLRELIIGYCVVFEKDKRAAGHLLDEMHNLILSIEGIQYHEFIAFWKALDMSYSVFKSLPKQKVILAELLGKYCEQRRKLYDGLGYSNITVQALYDAGSSRQKGKAGIEKIEKMMKDGLGRVAHCKTIPELDRNNTAYFTPDKGDKKLFFEFCKSERISYKFGSDRQGKLPDIVLKTGRHFFIVEAKHIKEGGGAQSGSVNETIDFIKYPEKSDFVHYISFMDGVYFNFFIWDEENGNKFSRQKADIKNRLEKNKNNFYVNTAGLKAILSDLK